uniref:RING-type E3 ubiquitin transferase n=1 Tax=Geospiza parvula TaxID=87175 RepID=A0A8C3NJK0_GEOPR
LSHLPRCEGLWVLHRSCPRAGNAGGVLGLSSTEGSLPFPAESFRYPVMSQLPPAGPSEMAAADGLCPICLGHLENATYVEVCQHRFCFICICEWAKLTETCPLCKQPFKQLLCAVTADNNHEERVAGCSARRQRKADRIRKFPRHGQLLSVGANLANPSD